MVLKNRKKKKQSNLRWENRCKDLEKRELIENL